MTIDYFSGPYWWLSNFYPCVVELDGESYPTVEHAYQAAKTRALEDRKIIQCAETPGQAKRYGQQVLLRSDWEDIKLKVMLELLRQKFELNSMLAARLTNTFPGDLVEGNYWDDEFWGVCNGVGENHLGKLLMLVREEVMQMKSGDGWPVDSAGEFLP